MTGAAPRDHDLRFDETGLIMVEGFYIKVIEADLAATMTAADAGLLPSVQHKRPGNGDN